MFIVKCEISKKYIFKRKCRCLQEMYSMLSEIEIDDDNDSKLRKEFCDKLSMCYMCKNRDCTIELPFY